MGCYTSYRYMFLSFILIFLLPGSVSFKLKNMKVIHFLSFFLSLQLKTFSLAVFARRSSKK